MSGLVRFERLRGGYVYVNPDAVADVTDGEGTAGGAVLGMRWARGEWPETIHVRGTAEEAAVALGGWR